MLPPEVLYTAELLARALQTYDRQLPMQRMQFCDVATAENCAFRKAGTYGSVTHWQMMSTLCAAELHQRAEGLGTAFLGTHKRLSASPASNVRRAAKDWIAARIADETKDVERHLPWPGRESASCLGSADLNAVAAREIQAASVRLDAAFDSFQRARTERLLRWVIRSWRSAIALRLIRPMR